MKLQTDTNCHTERIDHLGIVSGICQEIGLIEKVNTHIGTNGRQVSVGQAVQTMVLNGLGFVGRALYLTPEFFRNKKESFPDTVTAYRQQPKEAEESYFVADSALYTKDNIKRLSRLRWVTRVPLTLKLAQAALVACDQDEAQELAPGPWGCEYERIYGGIKQR